MKTKSTFQNLMRLAAMMMLLAVVTTAAWAQAPAGVSSNSIFWKIQKSTDNSRCIVNAYAGDKDDLTVFPAIIDGARVVQINIDFNAFANLETIYMYDAYEWSEMQLASFCYKLKHIQNDCRCYLK